MCKRLTIQANSYYSPELLLSTQELFTCSISLSFMSKWMIPAVRRSSVVWKKQHLHGTADNKVCGFSQVTTLQCENHSSFWVLVFPFVFCKWEAALLGCGHWFGLWRISGHWIIHLYCETCSFQFFLNLAECELRVYSSTSQNSSWYFH